jgi:uncharacterized repeat protein (TIGR03803 family)
MQRKTLSPKSRAFATIVAAALFLTSAWAADHETVLYNFGNNQYDGAGGTSLIRDAAGNLYGVTSTGGMYQCGISGCGTVFELSPVAGGGWTETVLHNFGNASDGAGPIGLMMDTSGNLYGLTQGGGLYGAGIAYELSPSQGGGWTEAILYNFSGGGYGNSLSYSLVKDAAGNLYGTMFFGGTYGEGLVFELSPSMSGLWTETVLHSFGSGTDGQYPEASVIMDAGGNLYGTTYQGGTYCSSLSGCGIVYELSRSGGGWTETVLHNFNGTDGLHPWANLLMDTAGNLYGTTYQGGAYCAPFGCGTVFELKPSNDGWTETVLHSFNEDGHDGYDPLGTLILDTNGNLYGTTEYGGINLYGTVFKLSPRVGGWNESVLYNFSSGNDGGNLFGTVVMDRAGDLYGTTTLGGLYGKGVAFQLTPPAVRPGPSAVR